jgi:two-component system cell cycle sensor histidine kinase/response regulator CckA
MIARLGTILRGNAPAKLLDRLRDLSDPLAALLLDDATGPACVIDAQGRLVRANAALALLCEGAALAPGDGIAQLFAVPQRDAAWADISATLRGLPARARSFVSNLACNQDELAIRVVVLPLREVGAESGGALLRLTDLTEQRQLEARLAHSQKLQATGELAGGIAHDFNNLLTAVLGAADGILAREAEGETSEDAVQIRASAQRGAALVRQLLAFGRQQRLEPRTISVNAAIEDVSGLLRRLLGGQIRLILALEQPGRQVRADPTQFDQVLINLAVNARDAMPQGGELTLRSGHITLYRPMLLGAETILPGRYVMIEVQDTGEGIAPEVLPRIFDPFFTTKRERGGSGLGLSTVHGIVRQSDGFLAVDSEPARGTSVRLYLPRWDGAEDLEIPAAPAQEPPPKMEPASGAVLLVDDEEPVRRLAARALRRAGWEVLEAESGESALEILHEMPVPPVAVISDMVMPGMDGAALSEAVRLLTGQAELPVILVSGYAQTQLCRGFAGDRTVFLVKPYTLANLVATLTQLVGTAASRAA